MIARILALILLAVCSTAGAALYKWVDEKGVTHYTQEPPPDGKATKIETRGDGPAVKPENPETWKDKETEFRRRRLEKERDEEKASARARNAAAQRRENCLRARDEVEIMSPGHPVYRINEKGERVYVEDAERETELKRWKKEVETWCGS